MRRDGVPLVSVITPVYNGEAYIETAIVSVLSQSYLNIELLIINDGSTDHTEEKVKRLANEDNRIRYFKQENKGVGAARNVGLKEMQGAYFCFLDADDCLTEGSIECRIQKFAEDDKLRFCDGQVIMFDESLTVPTAFWKPRTNGLVFRKLMQLSTKCFFGPTWLIKRDPSLKYSFAEDMTHAEDLLFFLEISKEGRYDFVDQVILHYRVSSNSAMRNLPGLARGYRSYFEKVLHKFGQDVTFLEKISLRLRVRKIMTLSFMAEGYFSDAIYFCFTGKVR